MLLVVLLDCACPERQGDSGPPMALCRDKEDKKKRKKGAKGEKEDSPDPSATEGGEDDDEDDDVSRCLFRTCVRSVHVAEQLQRTNMAA